jgi:actin-like ATPase involved in cell morphogenesis
VAAPIYTKKAGVKNEAPSSLFFFSMKKQTIFYEGEFAKNMLGKTKMTNRTMKRQRSGRTQSKQSISSIFSSICESGTFATSYFYFVFLMIEIFFFSIF